MNEWNDSNIKASDPYEADSQFEYRQGYLTEMLCRHWMPSDKYRDIAWNQFTAVSLQVPFFSLLTTNLYGKTLKSHMNIYI
jgi:hypothetical protein